MSFDAGTITADANISRNYTSGSYGWGGDSGRIVMLLEQYLPMLANMKVIMDSGQVVGLFAPGMDEELAKINARRGKGCMIGKVFFDGKDTYTEYGLPLLASKSISLPEVRTNMIDVPGRDGLLDASEVLTGEVTYKNRTIALILTGVDTVSGKKWPATLSDFCNKVHGKRVKVTFPEDTAHYYSGRCSVGQVELVKNKADNSVTVDCDPWKYKKEKQL